MNLTEAVAEACKQPTLVDALSWICVWDHERAIKQALEYKKTGVSTAAHGGWDTCFKTCIEAVMEAYGAEEDTKSEIAFEFKYCPGCDEVSRWEPHEEECDVCGEELMDKDSSEAGINLLIRTHERAEVAEALAEEKKGSVS